MTRDEEWLLKEKWDGEKAEGFFADAARLKLNEPLAYVIGSIPFLNTTIYLDSHPLIPRTETEYWVDQTIQKIKKNGTEMPIKILDLCAGSGCIGVSVLKELPHASVDFVEIDTHHHTTIEKNIRENEIDPARTNILGGDLFEQVTDTYDYILSNPPYIDPTVDRTQESVKTYEPSRALYGGKNGLEIIEKIIRDTPAYLTKDGILIIEHEPEQSFTISEHAAKNFNVTHMKDQFGIDRYTYLARKAT